MSLIFKKYLHVALAIFYCGGSILSSVTTAGAGSYTHSYSEFSSNFSDSLSLPQRSPQWREKSISKYNSILSNLYFKFPQNLEVARKIQCYYILPGKIASWQIQFDSPRNPADKVVSVAHSKTSSAKQLLRTALTSPSVVTAAQFASLAATAQGETSGKIANFTLSDQDRQMLKKLNECDQITFAEDKISWVFQEKTAVINLKPKNEAPIETDGFQREIELLETVGQTHSYQAFFDSPISFSDFFYILLQVQTHFRYGKNSKAYQIVGQRVLDAWEYVQDNSKQEDNSGMRDALLKIVDTFTKNARALINSSDLILPITTEESHRQHNRNVRSQAEQIVTVVDSLIKLIAKQEVTLPTFLILAQFLRHKILTMQCEIEKILTSVCHLPDITPTQLIAIKEIFPEHEIDALPWPRLVAFDFDGTISNGEKILPIFKNIIRMLLEEGVHVALISARTNQFLMMHLFPLGAWSPEILKRLHFYGEDGSEGFDWNETLGMYIRDNKHSIFVPEKNWPTIHGVTHAPDNGSPATLHRIFINYNNVMAYNKFQAWIGENHQGIECIRDFNKGYDYFLSMHDKGDAVAHLIRKYEDGKNDPWSHGKIWAAGDGPNDVPMFEQILAEKGHILFVGTNQSVIEEIKNTEEGKNLKSENNSILYFQEGPKHLAAGFLRRLAAHFSAKKSKSPVSSDEESGTPDRLKRSPDPSPVSSITEGSSDSAVPTVKRVKFFTDEETFSEGPQVNAVKRALDENSQEIGNPPQRLNQDFSEEEIKRIKRHCPNSANQSA